MVDFVGRTPDDSDYHGIKILLQQLFLKAHVNVGALADYIISHNYVGSVVKQEADDDDDDDDNDTSDVGDVFGVTSVINVSHGQVSSSNPVNNYFKLNLPLKKNVCSIKIMNYRMKNASNSCVVY